MRDVLPQFRQGDVLIREVVKPGLAFGIVQRDSRRQAERRSPALMDQPPLSSRHQHHGHARYWGNRLGLAREDLVHQIFELSEPMLLQDALSQGLLRVVRFGLRKSSAAKRSQEGMAVHTGTDCGMMRPFLTLFSVRTSSTWCGRGGWNPM